MQIRCFVTANKERPRIVIFFGKDQSGGTVVIRMAISIPLLNAVQIPDSDKAKIISLAPNISATPDRSLKLCSAKELFSVES